MKEDRPTRLKDVEGILRKGPAGIGIPVVKDVLRAVPRSLREVAYALGSTNFDVSIRVVTPAALSGILASFLLTMASAIGETMAVTIAAGATPKLTTNPLESISTMTAYVVQGEIIRHPAIERPGRQTDNTVP